MSDVGGVQEVGARLVLLNAAAFRAQLQQSTDALIEFNKEQAKAAETAKGTAKTVTDSAATQTDAVTDSADKQTAANAKVAASQDAVAASSTATRDKVVAASAATTAAHKKGAKALSEFSGKILAYGGALSLFVGYEGVKKSLAYNQAVTQGAINAGILAKQLPSLKAGYLGVSDATTVAATTVANMAYYLASANPLMVTHTKNLLAMSKAAAQMVVLEGASANPTATARAYGAIVSNQLALTPGSKPLAYSTAGGTSINEWLNAVTGHGDMTLGALTGALGTGILPIAKTYGLGLNELGAALDVLSPAMNANSASTRLKTAIGMLGSPSAKTSAAFELFGGNVTTAASILRSKAGLGGLLTYMNKLFSGQVTGKTFDNPFYGAGIGSLTGGTKGQGTGASEALRAMGFTVGQARVMEKSGGIAAFGKMSPAQLASVGFAGGINGAQAVQAAASLIYGGAFGSGHTGAAVLQLGNEVGTYKTKLGQISAGENPATYNAALKLAFSEPAVQLKMFGTALSNLTIAIGQDLTPDVVILSKGLLSVGNWFGKNKWAVEGLLGGAATIYGAAGVVKTVEVTSKLFGGIKSIASLGGTAPLTGNLALNTAAVNANTIALGGKLPKSLPGDVANDGLGATPLVAAAGTVASIGAATAAMYGIYRGANWLSSWATGFGRFASGYDGSGWSTKAPKVAQSAAARFNLAAQLAAKGQTMPSWLRNELSPSDIATIANYDRMPLGAVLPGAFGTKSKFTKTWAPASFAAQADWQRYVGGLSPAAAKAAWGNLSSRSPAQQAGLMNLMGTMGVGLGPAGTFLSSISAASKLKNPAAQGHGAFNASAQLVAAGVKQLDASDHMKMTASQLSEAYKSEAATLERLITSASDQTNAATQTESAANNLAAVTKELASAAVNLNNAAANSASAHAPNNIHAAAKAGLQHAIARK